MLNAKAGRQARAEVGIFIERSVETTTLRNAVLCTGLKNHAEVSPTQPPFKP